MAEPVVVDHAAERALEAKHLEELKQALKTLARMQQVFMADLHKPGELEATNGRRCLLVIEGLQFHRAAHYFEVRENGVTLVEPYDTYDTAIIAPLPSALRVLQATLAGVEDPFGEEWSRGLCKLRGEARFHDGWVFSDIFKRLSARIRRYRESLG